jgi:ATP-dependent exoDNAse (exonuclease V) beta subunit
MANLTRFAPPDQAQREQALEPDRSIIVQAPAGSGKTDLLTRRFLRLLAEVNSPTEIVAITFTKAAAAEMRHRILSELEKAAFHPENSESTDTSSMPALANRALQRSLALGWNLIDLPSQLRISTVDSFCRELAIRQPLLGGLGGGLNITEQPGELYRRAARSTLQRLGSDESSTLNHAMEALLSWRDNGWQELENQLVEMLEKRDHWMQEFWMRDFSTHREPDWNALRETLERPFFRAVADALEELNQLLAQVPGACNEALELAQFACGQSDNTLHRELAELAEFPCGPFVTIDELDDALNAYRCLANLLLTQGGSFRKTVNKANGFPADRKREKERHHTLVADLSQVPALEAVLAALPNLPPPRYSEDDWSIVRSCFTILFHAVAELKVAFSESGVVDFVEVAQVAQRVLQGDDQLPTESAFTLADGIHHLLVDEFQDTSRRQLKLIASLVSAWPDQARSLFVVGDPMQSIYFFRDADAELFPRVRTAGLELPDAPPLALDFVRLSSNFRTAAELVDRLNHAFEAVFGEDDGSGVNFTPAQPARPPAENATARFRLHLEFVPQPPRGGTGESASVGSKQEAADSCEAASERQIKAIVDLIRSHARRIEQAHTLGDKYRVAVLGRTRSALSPIARALREAAIPFRSVDLEQLSDRPEVLDALALARTLFNPEDRVAWLGVLRAPWCGLSLADLHILAGSDDPDLMRHPLPDLMRERVSMLSPQGQFATARLLETLPIAARLRAAFPASSLGTWLEQVWLSLGGANCVDSTARANVNLLWRCLDNLPDGEPDLLGRGLTTALARLTALPDPNALADHGVQLMTIHKSKGLEFEVVIIPELQGRCALSHGKLLSWLERGIAAPDESGELTEFLVAPLPTKGSESNLTRKWVDRAYQLREQQEMRRILYVAATRARDELHLFARPSFKTDQSQPTLCEPFGSLLCTAWPALEEEVRARFDAFRSQHLETQIASIAASENNLLQMPSPPKPAILRRLPLDFHPAAPALESSSPSGLIRPADASLYIRHEGGLLSRALGSAVHALFEQLARLRSVHDANTAQAMLSQYAPRIISETRSAGLTLQQSQTIAQQALQIAHRAAHDPVADWILSAHPDGASELRWTGVISQKLRTVQIDRIFRAGANPLSTGTDAWWIIDYKTAHEETTDSVNALSRLRPLFAPQLELYAEFLRMLHGKDTLIRAGLYYPRMLQFDWWEQ